MKVRCVGCFKMYNDEFEICPECGHYKGKPAKEPYQLYPGVVLAERYVIGNVLGFGGFGVTYKAWDKKLESVVCIKEYYPSGIVNRDPGTCKLILLSGKKNKEFEYGLIRFIDEARNMTKFNAHKNIVNVYEYFEENNTAYIVMEFLDGCTLGEYMEKENGKLPLDRGIDIIMCIGNALKDVHANGIIHRDVSPDNIFLCNDGTIKLIDFGAARFSSEEAKNFTIILKPGFAPPEQYEQISDQGPKTDVYALGATLYYVITGVKPDESTNRKIQDVLEEPNHLVPEIPQHINDTILKAMAIEPHLRFESVDEFEKSLKQEIKVTSLKKEKRVKKMKRLIGILSLATVVVFAGAIFGINLYERNKQVTLEPATIDVWYSAEKNDGVDAAYRKVIKKFTEDYKTVKVKINVVSSSEYDAALEAAMKTKNAPNLFISNDMSYNDLKGMADLSEVIFPKTGNSAVYRLISMLTSGVAKECYFFENYDEQFPEHKQVPVSFNVPVMYVNTSIVSEFKEEEIDNYDDIKGYLGNGNKIVINPDYQKQFTDIFGIGLSDTVVKGSAEQFAKGDVAFYFSDTSEFFNCRKLFESGLATYKVVPITGESVECSYYTYWSVKSVSEAEDAAAYRLLGEFLSEYSQSTVYGTKNSEKALPVNKKSLDRFVSEEYGYSDLAFVGKNVGIYTFESGNG